MMRHVCRALRGTDIGSRSSRSARPNSYSVPELINDWPGVTLAGLCFLLLIDATQCRQEGGVFYMIRWTNRAARFVTLAIGMFLAAALFLPAAPLSAEPDDDAAIAKSLADMLRAGRQVSSNNQSRSNDPNIGDKGLNVQVG